MPRGSQELPEHAGGGRVAQPLAEDAGPLSHERRRDRYSTASAPGCATCSPTWKTGPRRAGGCPRLTTEAPRGGRLGKETLYTRIREECETGDCTVASLPAPGTGKRPSRAVKGGNGRAPGRGAILTFSGWDDLEEWSSLDSLTGRGCPPHPATYLKEIPRCRRSRRFDATRLTPALEAVVDITRCSRFGPVLS